MFLNKIYDAFQRSIDSIIMANKNKKKKATPLPYLHEYYNLAGFYYSNPSAYRFTTTRLINSVMNAINSTNRLLRLAVIILDKEFFEDVDIFENNQEVFEEMETLINWITRQIDIQFRRKRLQILEKRPGTALENEPIIIFTTLMRRVDRYEPNSKMERVCELRAEFNELLNEAIAHQCHHIMAIKGCKLHDHFDKWGYLSEKGKRAYWNEMDHLVDMFDAGKIKLLPHGWQRYSMTQDDKDQNNAN